MQKALSFFHKGIINNDSFILELVPDDKVEGKKEWEKFTRLKQGQKLPPNGDNMQGFNQTPWNATSRTTAQDALW